MSKHEKTIRRQRRKTDAARRKLSHARVFRNPKSAIRNGAAVLAAAAAIAAGTSAYADTVRFDNPPHGEAGHFHWPNIPGNRALDLTAPASEQPPDVPPHVTWAVQQGDGSYSSLGSFGNESPQFQEVGYLIPPNNAGDPIPSAFDWYPDPLIYYAGLGGSLLPEGVSTYVGTRFDPGDGFHYGWIGVVRTGLELEAFAWGYETEPGVPIAAGAEGGGGCTEDADCDDGEACTTDVCDTETGACSNELVDCNDDDACTVDACDAETGECVNEAIVCEEGQKCVEGECVCDTNCPADLNGDGVVGPADLAMLLASWGKCPE